MIWIDMNDLWNRSTDMPLAFGKVIRTQQDQRCRGVPPGALMQGISVKKRFGHWQKRRIGSWRGVSIRGSAWCTQFANAKNQP